MRMFKKITAIVMIGLMFMVLVPSAPMVSSAAENATVELVTKEEVPEILSYKQIEQAGHTKRLYSQENDLNTVLFENQDGTNSMYMFSENVKYIG